MEIPKKLKSKDKHEKSQDGDRVKSVSKGCGREFSKKKIDPHASVWSGSMFAIFSAWMIPAHVVLDRNDSKTPSFLRQGAIHWCDAGSRAQHVRLFNNTIRFAFSVADHYFVTYNAMDSSSPADYCWLYHDLFFNCLRQPHDFRNVTNLI